MDGIRFFQIFGERNSGTKYVQRVLNRNLRINPTSAFGFKHWYVKGHQPRGEENRTTDNECIRSLDGSDDTIFVFIVRDPYSWIQSMRSKPHHAPLHRNMGLSEFIRKEWISYETKRANKMWPPSADNYYFIERAENICALRRSKNAHFMSIGNRVRNFHTIRHHAMNQGIREMVELFGLETIGKGLSFDGFRSPKNYPPIPKEDKRFIDSHLDPDAEKSLGYDLLDPRTKGAVA